MGSKYKDWIIPVYEKFVNEKKPLDGQALTMDNIVKFYKDKKEDSSINWTSLQHNGPLFARKYVPLPDNVHFYTNRRN
jgi:hypothetical protein